jgi:hypothetical protein
VVSVPETGGGFSFQPIMGNPVVRWVVLILIACVLAVAGAWGLSVYTSRKRPPKPLTAEQLRRLEEARPQPAAPDTGKGEKQNLFKIIAAAPPLESGQFRPEQLQEIFPAFQHRPFESAGFNEVMLPFSYSDPDHLGNSSEAMALTALISGDLDWSPGCYCARHAYFVFKRDREYVQRFLHGYDPALIASFINQWQATHAVGGQLIRTAHGYKGKLQVFDAKGAVILTRQYDTVRSYWDLLADMDTDAMTALDAKPADSLVQYLRQPRCGHFQSIVELGSAALMEEKSPEEFGVYRKIIEDDPGFSMVRHWYANQKHWNDGDVGYWETQNGQALSSRIEIASLEEFTAAACPDEALAGRLPEWLDHADEIAGTNLPKVLCCRLRNGVYGARTDGQVFGAALQVAGKYPNSHELLVQLGTRSQDRLLGASLLAASLFDRWEKPMGGRADELYDLAWVCDLIGREDVTQELISILGPEQSKAHLDLLLQSLCRSGHYSQAADLYPLLDSRVTNSAAREQMAPYAFFAAFMADKPDLLDRVYREQGDVLERLHLTGVFQNYLDGFHNKKFVLNVNTSFVDYAGLWNLFQVAFTNGLQGDSSYHHLQTEAMFHWPMNRLVWMVQDNYQRRDPSPDAGAFYEYLEMFFPYDPWVKIAVADFHKREDATKPIDAAMLRADLQDRLSAGQYPFAMVDLDWRHVVTPWRVAACVDQLLKQHKTHDAAEIALLYRSFVDGSKNTWQVTIAGELERRASVAQSN